MRRHTWIEEGDFTCTCWADPLPDGKWEATVSFELKSDQSKTHVPGMRHRLKASFDDENAAVSAAIDHAQQCIAKGDTGLE